MANTVLPPARDARLKPDSRVTGWSVNIYESNPRDPDVKATKIAKQFIELIDKELQQKNIHVLMGKELEIDMIPHSTRTEESLNERALSTQTTRTLDSK